MEIMTMEQNRGGARRYDNNYGINPKLIVYTKKMFNMRWFIFRVQDISSACSRDIVDAAIFGAKIQTLVRCKQLNPDETFLMIIKHCKIE